MKKITAMRLPDLLRLAALALFCFLTQFSKAQTWTPDAPIFSFWSQDPGPSTSPGTPLPTWTIYNNAAANNGYSQYNSAYLVSAPPALTAGSGVTVSYVGTMHSTSHRVENVNTCSSTDAVAANDYIGAQITLKPSGTPLRTLRVRKLTFQTFWDDANQSSSFQVTFAIKDITTNGPLQYVFTGFNSQTPTWNNTGWAMYDHTVDPATFASGWGNAVMVPGHTYELRFYLNSIPGACNPATAPTVKNFDNPVIYTEEVNPITISGKVYNDVDGASNGINNLSGVQLGGLNAVLVDADGNVVTTTPVDGFGNYSFAGVDPINTFTVLLTTANPTAGTQAPTTSSLPAGWASTGENVGPGSSTANDGTPNGISASFTPTGNTEVNFGIEQPPVAVDDNLGGQTFGQPATVPNILINDRDPSDGTGGSTLNPANISLVLPTGVAITGMSSDAQGDITGFTRPGEGTWTLNSDGSVTFTPQSGFKSSPTPIKYTVRDAAGLASNQATITITYDIALAVNFGPIDARLKKGTLYVKWNTLTEENCKEYTVEGSVDGKNWKALGTVLSKARDGNSSTPLDYEFSTSAGALTVAGMGLAALLLLPSVRRKRTKWLVAIAAVLTIAACTKQVADEIATVDQPAYIRIAQKDIDGAVQYSKVYKVETE